MRKEIITKLLIYTFIVLFFGLLQVWLGAIIYSLGQKPFSFWKFLTQYGVYFFASSLVASSWWKHCKLFKNVESTESVVSTIGAFVFIILLIAVYFSGLTYDGEGLQYEFNASSSHQLIALFSIIASISYGVFTEKRTYEARSTKTEIVQQ